MHILLLTPIATPALPSPWTYVGAKLMQCLPCIAAASLLILTCLPCRSTYITLLRCNARGDLMLSALNLTSHLMYDEVRYVLPGSNTNDKLAAAAGLSMPAAAAGSANGSTAKYNQS